MPPGRMFGSKKQGPDLSWADEDIADPNDRSNRAVSPPSNVPGPLFPPRSQRNIIRTPKPQSASEKRAVDAQLRFRQRCREGPLFTVLDRNGLLVDGVKRQSEEAKRRGFDPFEQQERYSTKHVKKVRTEPDLGPSGRGDYGYTLAMFPQELWGVLDPQQRLPDWQNVKEDSVAYASLGKRPVRKKRKKGLDYERQDRERALAGQQEIEQESDDSDAIRRGGRKKRKEVKPAGQKTGMDAEDDLDAEANPEELDEEAGESAPEDSDFSESENNDDDYNAEQYFDDGEDDAGDDEYGAGGTEDY
ncbi:DNA-directed RNA polymerase III subunit C31 [Knufia fluminis]|uniref:DNA-directed RNA polymerase III subunit n=1 Tax=Knufia fluminis TaxID=191047 RepID=A0AAN8F4Y1_9EURO|nr:DNA-directed RNA polymerase III subunit C31 [Knufia fluminis]